MSDPAFPSATDVSTSVTVAPEVNFQILDQTTGQTSTSAGMPYTGPTAGLTTEFADLSPDNLNIAALTPNVFIYSGTGEDGINAFSARWHGHEEALAAEQQGQESAYLATTPDDFTTRVVWAGEGVDLINDIPTASQIIERIIAQAAETLMQGSQLVRGNAARLT